MNRERKPPKTWRRNMVTAAAFLVLLDAIIISGTPSSARIEFALFVTIIVGFAIARIWRTNTDRERAGADSGKSESGGSRPARGKQ